MTTQLLDQVLRPKGGRMVSRGEFARGGMSALELVDDLALLREVVAKSIRREERHDEFVVRGFLREAQVAAQLDHPNIVPLYELGATLDDCPYFTMKHLQGRTMHTIIKDISEEGLDQGRLLDLLDVVLRVCDALAFAHSRGVVHCDVKPSNVMVADYGQVYLMDWGIAELIEVAGPSDARPVVCSVEATPRASIKGTPAYMAPELARGAAVDVRTDVFSVGVLLYCIVCRRTPYGSADSRSTLGRALRCQFPRPSDVTENAPPELERIILKAMASEPEDRYQSILELQRDLLRFVRGGGDFPRVEFADGEYIVREGEVGDAAYIIEMGRCAVVRGVGDVGERLREMGPGEVFGETAILAASPRTASVIALGPTAVRVVTREILEQEVGAMKPWMAAFIRTLARRFQERETARRREP